MQEYRDFWKAVYIASLQGSRTDGSIARSQLSSLYSTRAAEDADEALAEYKRRIKNGDFE